MWSRIVIPILAIASLSAQNLPPGITKGATVEGITEYKLSNGLQVLLFPEASKPTVTVNVTYMVGSRHESYGETGMAHLLEHMVFKPTSNRGDIKKELNDHGALYNGSTAWDRTNYFERLQASDENLRWAIEMEADRMVNAKVAKTDLDSEMTVVRSEFEMGENSPGRVLLFRTLATAYLWHNYGKVPIGARSDIEHVPIDRLQAFYRKWYQPDNAMLVIAGKFDEKKTLDWIVNSFGKIPKPARVIQKTYTEEPTQDGERSVVLRRVGDTQSVIAMYHVPAGSHPDYEAVQVLTAILGETPSGRLYKSLVENKLATSAGGEDIPLREPGVVLFTASLRKEQSLDAAREALLKTLDEVSKETPSKEEVDRAKTRLLKQVDLSLNNAENIGVELSEWSSMGDWRLLFLQRDKLKAVTPADVARVAKAYLKPSNRTIGQFIPEANPDRSEIPAAPDVEALLKDFKGGTALASGESFDPSHANIDARTQRFVLPNGMKVALLPKKTRGGSVNAAIGLQFGELDSLRGLSVIGSATGSQLMRGTARKTRQQIQDELDKMKARLNVNGGPTAANASIDTVHDSLAGALKLAAEVLRQPAFPERELEQWKQQTIANIERSKNEPQVLASVAVNKYLQQYPADDVRASPVPEEQIALIKAVTVEDVKKFYAKFYGASHAEIAVVGDFDPAEVKKLVTDLFGDWKSAPPYKRITKIYTPMPPINKMIEAPDKANAFFFAGMNLKLREEDADYPAMDFAAYLLGGGLKGRLPSRIREKEGLSYTVQSFLNAPDKDTGSMLMAIAICAPTNILKVEAAFRDEMDKILKEGFSVDEVDKFKASWKQEQQISRTQDGAMARHLAQNEALGRTMAYDAKQEAAVMALTAQQVNDTLRKYVKTADFSIAKSGDFKKAGISQ